MNTFSLILVENRDPTMLLAIVIPPVLGHAQKHATVARGSRLHASASCSNGHYCFDRKRAFLNNRE